MRDYGVHLYGGELGDILLKKKDVPEGCRPGNAIEVFVFLDLETNRITASAKLDKFLSQEPPDYKEGAEVDLVIYEQTDLGYKAVVNHAHGGMVYKNEAFQKLLVGQRLKGYIKKIRQDHKIDLSLQQLGYQGVDAVSRTILKTIKDRGGRIAVTDKSPPEVICGLFRVSKKTFKKGHRRSV
jgi:CRISPR-associated protein Cas8b1/Cst1 subtype I-B